MSNFEVHYSSCGAMIARLTSNQKAVGSSPIWSIYFNFLNWTASWHKPHCWTVQKPMKAQTRTSTHGEGYSHDMIVSVVAVLQLKCHLG